MSKRTFSKKTIILVAITAVIVGGTIGAIFFLQPLISGDVLPPLPDIPDEFMIPIDDINENNDMLIDEIKDLVECDPPELLMEEELCQIDKMLIDEKEDQLIILEPMNMTDFSEDDSTTQICDQLDLGCGSEIMDLRATITKIDSQGKKTIITKTFGISQLAFLADPTDFDFKDGFLELELEINTKRTLSITSSGLFDVFLNGKSVFIEPVVIRGNGVTNENGQLSIEFLSPTTGIPSPLYTFNFGLNFDKFNNELVNPLELRLLNLDVNKNQEMFSITNQTIITLDIFRDDIKLIIEDEKTGETLRVFPTDSRIIVNTVAKTLKSISGACAGRIVTTAPPPQIGRIEVFDENDKLVVFSNGGSGQGVLDELLTRNANYTMTIFFPTDETFLEYGKSQETKSFSCYSELASNTCSVSCKTQIKAGGARWTHCSDFVSSFIISNTPVCNLP